MNKNDTVIIKALKKNGGGLVVPLPIAWLDQIGIESAKGVKVELTKGKTFIKINRVVNNQEVSNG